MSKVLLDIERETNEWFKATYPPRMVIRSILPFAQSRKGVYVHRIRAAWVGVSKYNYEKGIPHSTILKYWCGATGFLPDKCRLFASVPAASVQCAVCEGKWIGAGGDDRKINGRDVMYAPRGERYE